MLLHGLQVAQKIALYFRLLIQSGMFKFSLRGLTWISCLQIQFGKLISVFSGIDFLKPSFEPTPLGDDNIKSLLASSDVRFHLRICYGVINTIKKRYHNNTIPLQTRPI